MPVTISSTLMQNHVAGTPPVPQKQLAVVTASDQSPILFAVDTKDRLTVTMRDPSQTTGWVQIPLSDQLAGIDGLGAAPLAQSFAAVQDSDGCIWLALAASAGDPDAESRLYISPRLGDDMTPDDWRQFAKLLVRRPTPAGLAFSELVLGSGDDGGGFPAIVAGTKLVSGSTQHYVINPDTTDTTWTCLPFKLPDQATSCLAMAAGNAPGLGRGVYALCATGETTDSLTFTTMPVIDPDGQPQTTVLHLDLPYHYAPTSTAALAALPVRDGLTELYVSGAGLQRYPLSLQKGDNLGLPIELADKTYFVLSPQLSVSSDPAASRIDVWALNFSDQLVHTTGMVDTTGAAPDDEPVYTWSPPLTMAVEITALAAYRALIPLADDTGRPGAGYPTQGAVAIAFRDRLALMLKSSESELWQTQGISFQVPDDTYTINSYTTQISVTDDDNIALSNAEVLIRPSFDVPALVNGRYYALRSGAAKTAYTDVYGTVTVVLETTDLAPPVYEVTVAGSPATEEDPAEDLVTELKKIQTPDQIYYAQRSDGGALFPDPKPPNLMDQCAVALDGIEGLMAVYDELPGAGGHARRGHRHHEHGREHGPGRPRREPFAVGCHFAADGSVTRHRGQAALDALPAPDGWEWLDSVGDALMSAINGAEKVVSWTLDALGEVADFAIQLADRTIAFVISLAEQAMAVLDFVFQATLGISLSDIIAWLGFLFDWGDVLQTHRVIGKICDLGFPYIMSQVDVAKAWIDEALGWAPDKLLPIGEDDPPFAERARQNTASPNSAMDTPQAGWGNRQFLTNAPSGKVSAVVPPDNGDPFADISQHVIDDMTAIGNATAQAIADGFTTMDWAQVLDTYVQQIRDTFYGDVQYIADQTLNALVMCVKSFQEMATAHWDIPVLTWFYENVISPGSKLSLQDLAVLLAAIPATVTAKALTGQNAFSDQASAVILNATTWDQMIDGIMALSAGAAAGDTADNPTALRLGAELVLIGGGLRAVGAAAFVVSKLMPGTVGDFAASLVKNYVEWVAWIFSFANSVIVQRTRTETTERMKLDWQVLMLGLLPLTRDSYLIYYQTRYGRPSPQQANLAMLEVGYGVFQLELACKVVGMEWGEDAPPRTSKKDFQDMVGVKFGVNCSAALNSCLAVEEALPPGELQTALQIARVALSTIEVGCGIYIGYVGMQHEQSDTGIA